MSALALTRSAIRDALAVLTSEANALGHQEADFVMSQFAPRPGVGRATVAERRQLFYARAWVADLRKPVRTAA